MIIHTKNMSVSFLCEQTNSSGTINMHAELAGTKRIYPILGMFLDSRKNHLLLLLDEDIHSENNLSLAPKLPFNKNVFETNPIIFLAPAKDIERKYTAVALDIQDNVLVVIGIRNFFC